MEGKASERVVDGVTEVGPAGGGLVMIEEGIGRGSLGDEDVPEACFSYDRR